MKKGLFSSESVSPGHPDKVCDYISDLVLDSYLCIDPKAKVACETMIKDDYIILAGEISSRAKVDVEKIVSDVYKHIGYDIKPKIINYLNKQSPDIALGTNESVGGAGDQGIMFGYAINETKNYMPMAYHLATSLIKRADTLRKSGVFKWAKPDMKSQVTFDYNKNKVHTVLMSIQHDEEYIEEEFKDFVKKMITDVLIENKLNTDFNLLINPTGRFVIGGPIGDAGVTGRKIIVDTYGGYAPHGGGAFSGKDPTKVDRSASYMARYLAKNIVAAGLCNECLIQIAYAIGIKEPVSFHIETDNENLDIDRLRDSLLTIVDLTPHGIINKFNLRRPLYTIWSKYGAFGEFIKEDIIVPWEELSLVDELKKLDIIKEEATSNKK